MSQDIRIGMIGAGGIARQRHLPGLAKIPYARVVVVSNRSLESGERIASEFGIPEVAADWRQVVRRKDIDAVFVCTWPSTHREMSNAALEEGKHVFCQARMAMDLSEAKEMEKTASDNPHLVNMICPPPHRILHEPAIKELLSSDEMGVLTSAEVVSLTGRNTDRESFSWREDKSLSGLQALLLGIYAEVINAWLGPYQRLYAETSIPIAEKREENGSIRPVYIPQVITVAGRLVSGALMTEHHSGLIAHRQEPENHIVVRGLKGTMKYSFGVPHPEILYAAEGKDFDVWKSPANKERSWQVEQDFIDAVRAALEGRTWSVSPDFREGLQYMRKVQAVYESARSGKAVDPMEL